MILLPVVARELGLVVRRASTYRMRVGGAIVGLLAMSWILLVSSAGLASGTQGKLLFRGVAGIVFYYCLAVGPTLVADAVSAERRQGTLGLLFLTDLKGYDVILGKLAAASATAMFTVLSLIPVSSAGVLLGGVTLGDVGRMALVWVSTLFASASIGICVSSFCSDDRKAMVGSVLCVFALGYAAYGPAELLRQFAGDRAALAAWGEVIESCSAGHAFTTTADWIPGTRRIWPFCVSIGFLWGVGIVALLVASRRVEELTAGKPKSAWKTRWESIANGWAYGSLAARARRRGRLLDLNPFLWLLSRHQRKQAYMWGFLACMGAIWMWVTRYVPGLGWEWSFNGFVFLFLGAMVKNWWASEVGERFVEDRQNGALELVFTTSVTPEEFARGQGMALRRIFGGPIFGMLLLELAWLFLAFPRFIEGQGLLAWLAVATVWGVLAVDLWALKWLGLWHGLVYPSSNRASTATLMKLGVGPWTVVIAFVSIYSYWLNYAAGRGMSTWDSCVMILAYGATSLIFAVIFGVRARRRFLSGFRHVASEGLQAAAIESALARSPVLPAALSIEKRVSESRAEPLSRRSWLRRHWLVTGFASLCLLVAGSGLGFRWYWEWRMASKLKALESVGIPVSVEDFNAAQGVVERDGEAIRFWDSIGSIQGRNTLHRIRVEQFAVGKAPKEMREIALKFVESNPKAGNWLAAVGRVKPRPSHLDRAIFRPVMNASAMNLSHVALLSAMRGVFQVERGEREAAIETAVQLLELCRFMETAASQYDQAFFLESSLQQTTALLHLILRTGTIPEAAQRRMDSLLEELGGDKMARIHQLSTLVALVDFNRDPARWSGANRITLVGSFPATVAFLDGASRYLGFRARSEVQFLEEVSSLVEASQQPEPALYARSITLQPRGMDAISFMIPTGLPIHGRAVGLAQMDTRSMGRCRSLRLALRADGHHAKTGIWTANISDLVEKAESSKFVSPMTGKPLVLEPLPGGTGILVSAEPPEARQPPSDTIVTRGQAEFLIDRSGGKPGAKPKP